MKSHQPKSGYRVSGYDNGEARSDSAAEPAGSSCCAIPGTSLSICIGEQVGLAIEEHYRERRTSARPPAAPPTGILLGRYETGKRKIASLEQLYPAAWRPAYDSERRPLTPGQLFTPLVSADAKIQPVGFYVFAGRPDAALFHRDLSFFSLYFTNPDSIFVIFSRTVDAIVAHVYARGREKTPRHSISVTLHLDDLVDGPQSPPSIPNFGEPLPSGHPPLNSAAEAPPATSKSAEPSSPPTTSHPLPQPAVGAPSAISNSAAPPSPRTPSHALKAPAAEAPSATSQSATPSSPLAASPRLPKLAADAPTSFPESAGPSSSLATGPPSPESFADAPSKIAKSADPSNPLTIIKPLPEPAAPSEISNSAVPSRALTTTESLPEPPVNVPASSFRNTSSAIPLPTVPRGPLTTSHPRPNLDADAPNRVPRNTLWAVVAITVISAGAAWYTLSNRTLKPFTPDRIGLRIVQTGPDVQIAWDAASPALQGATLAVFQIRDGTGNKDITLSPEELKRGRLLYIAVTNDLDIHMRVLKPDNRTAEDSVRMIGRLPDQQDSQTTQSAVSPLRPASRLAQTVRPAIAEPLAARSVKPFTPPAPMAETSSQSGVAVSTLSPPQLPPQAGQPDAAFPLPYRETTAVQPPPSVPPAMPEQVPPQTVRSTQAQSAVIPPKPRRLVPLVVPEHLRRSIVRDLSIDIHCRVGVDGQVTSVTTPHAKASLEGQLAALAAATARNWLFTPARLHGQPVSSDYVITFSFHRNTP